MLYTMYMTKATRMKQPESAVKLTSKQEAFCNEFIKDLNITQAAMRAGYSPKHARNNAYALTQDPAIVQRIADKSEQEGDYISAIRSLELLGKHQAMWTDKNITEMEVRNAFATGNSDADIARDIERLKRIATPKINKEQLN